MEVYVIIRIQLTYCYILHTHIKYLYRAMALNCRLVGLQFVTSEGVSLWKIICTKNVP